MNSAIVVISAVLTLPTAAGQNSACDPSAEDQAFCVYARCTFYMEHIAEGMDTTTWQEMARDCPASFCNIDAWLGDCATNSPTSAPTSAPTSPTAAPTSAPITANCPPGNSDRSPGSTVLPPKLMTSDGAIWVQGSEVTLASPCGRISASVLAGLPAVIEQVRSDAMTAVADLNSTVRSSISRAVEQAATRTDSAESRTNATIRQLQGQIDTLQRDLAAATVGLAELVPRTTAAETAATALTSRTTAVETSIRATTANFQMPLLNGWRQSGSGVATTCVQGQHGMMRRISGSRPRERKGIVVCDGTHWNLLPMVGKGANNRLPGGGCVMRDVFSYNTGSSGCRNIDMKTNIRVRSATMVDISLKGYNYGSATHVDNHLVFYTYQGWSCTGQRAHQNYGNGGDISDYCSSDGFVVIRLRPRSSSYYIGFSMDASFLNPTGQQMCGLFEITAARCNGGY